MAIKFYGAINAIGGTTGALDSIDGTTLNDGDKAFVVLSSGLTLRYVLDADSGQAEDTTYYSVVSPDANAGTKRWIRLWSGGRTVVPGGTVDQGDVAEVGSLTWHVNDINTDDDTITFEPAAYDLTTSESVPANVKLKFEKGAVLDGSGTLTLDNPAQIQAASDQQIFDTSITVAFTNPGEVPVTWFGDDAAAFTTAVASLPTNGTLVIPKALTYTSAVTTGAKFINIICRDGGGITSSVNNAPIIKIEQGLRNQYVLDVKGSSIDGTSGGVAIQFGNSGNTVGFKNCRMEIFRANNRETGVKLLSDATGGVLYYNQFYLHEIRSNQIAVSLDSDTNGNINANDFWGGQLYIEPTNYNTVIRTGVALNGTGGCADNSFHDMEINIDTDTAPTAIARAVYANGAGTLWNRFSGIYLDSSNDLSVAEYYIIDVNGGAAYNKVSGYFDKRVGSSWRTTAQLINESSATYIGMNIVDITNLPAGHMPGGLKEVFPENDLYGNTTINNNGYIFIPGFCQLANSDGSIIDRITGGTLYDGYILLGSDAIGRIVNVSTVKQFFIRHDFVSGDDADYVIQCYDAAGTLLTGTSPYYVDGFSTDYDDPERIATTADFGSSGTPAYVVAAKYEGAWVAFHSDVKSAFIGVTANSGTINVSELSVSCAGTQETPASWIQSTTTVRRENAIQDAMRNSASPLGGFPGVGDMVFENQPSSGNPWGWSCIRQGYSLANGGEPAAETDVAVDDDGTATNGDVFGVVLDNDLWHWTTINGAPAGNVIVMADAVPGGRTIPDNAKVTWFKMNATANLA